MNSLFLEAESFSQRGGWVVDPAAMGEMGSAYLMAHGAGVPVADAETSIEIPEAGEYHIWARTRDWTAVWKRGTPAGRFTIRISGYELPQVLGTNGEKWAWQKAGSLRLSAGEHTVALHDLTGFNGRCDALYFSTDPMDVPPDGGRALEEFRKEKCAIIPVDDPGNYDLIVAGGGMAGSVTALAAARLGLHVLLLQDRAVLIRNNQTAVIGMGIGVCEQGRKPALLSVILHKTVEIDIKYGVRIEEQKILGEFILEVKECPSIPERLALEEIFDLYAEWLPRRGRYAAAVAEVVHDDIPEVTDS